VRFIAAATAALLSLCLAAPAPAEQVKEPSSGVIFDTTATAKVADQDVALSLLGVGLRVKKIAFVSAKVYAIGLYVSDTALAGPLAAHKGKPASEALYQDLIWGDFPKQVVLKFTRTVGQNKIQEAMREALAGADKTRTEQFVSYFPEVKEGQECVLRWAPGGTLEVSMAGLGRPPIADKNFAAAVFGIWMRQEPLQDDIKKALISRF